MCLLGFATGPPCPAPRMASLRPNTGLGVGEAGRSWLLLRASSLGLAGNAMVEGFWEHVRGKVAGACLDLGLTQPWPAHLGVWPENRL